MCRYASWVMSSGRWMWEAICIFYWIEEEPERVATVMRVLFAGTDYARKVSAERGHPELGRGAAFAGEARLFLEGRARDVGERPVAPLISLWRFSRCSANIHPPISATSNVSP